MQKSNRQRPRFTATHYPNINIFFLNLVYYDVVVTCGDIRD